MDVVIMSSGINLLAMLYRLLKIRSKLFIAPCKRMSIRMLSLPKLKLICKASFRSFRGLVSIQIESKKNVKKWLRVLISHFDCNLSSM